MVLRLIFLNTEGISGKPINPEKRRFCAFIGFVLLMGLMLIIRLLRKILFDSISTKGWCRNSENLQKKNQAGILQGYSNEG